MANKCENCGRTDRLIHDHHISYERDETVPVCSRCHYDIHKNPDHELYPEDTRGVKNINIQFSKEEFARAKALKKLVGGSWFQAVTEGLEALAEREGIDVEAEQKP